MPLDMKTILKELKPFCKRKAFVEPERAAFLAIDLQNYFKPIVQPILGNLLRVLRACRKKNLPVIFTQHGHTDPSSDGGMLGEWWGELILVGTKAWEFLPEITRDERDRILPKKRYSAFFETDLDTQLRSRGIQEVIISGVMTNLCCETTARDAFMRDYRVFVLIDGTAAGRKELHLAALKNLGFGFAHLLTCDELIEALK